MSRYYRVEANEKVAADHCARQLAYHLHSLCSEYGITRNIKIAGPAILKVDNAVNVAALADRGRMVNGEHITWGVTDITEQVLFGRTRGVDTSAWQGVQAG